MSGSAVAASSCARALISRGGAARRPVRHQDAGGEGVQRVGALLVGNIYAAGDFDITAPPDTGVDDFPVLAGTLPLLLGLIAVAAVTVGVAQGGFLFAPSLLMPKGERVNPI